MNAANVVHIGCRKWTATLCGFEVKPATLTVAAVMAIADSFEEADSCVTAIMERVTCPVCLTMLDRAAELGYRGKPAWLGPRSDRSWWWKKKHAPKDARPCRIARPSSIGGWHAANGLTPADLKRGETW